MVPRLNELSCTLFHLGGHGIAIDPKILHNISELMTSSGGTKALAGRRLVVIGGTAGLGLSAVKAFVKAGARVMAVGLKPEIAAQAQS